MIDCSNNWLQRLDAYMFARLRELECRNQRITGWIIGRVFSFAEHFVNISAADEGSISGDTGVENVMNSLTTSIVLEVAGEVGWIDFPTDVKCDESSCVRQEAMKRKSYIVQRMPCGENLWGICFVSKGNLSCNIIVKK